MVYKTSNMGRVTLVQRLRCKSLSYALRKNATRLKPSQGPPSTVSSHTAARCKTSTRLLDFYSSYQIGSLAII